MTTEQYHDGHGRTTVAVVDSWSVPASRSRWGRYIWVWAGIWLVYLAQPAVTAWHLPVLWHRVAALAGLAVFAVVFLGGFVLARERLRVGQTLDRPRAVGILVAAVALLGLVTALLGQDGLALFVYVGVMSVYLLPGRDGPIVVLGLDHVPPAGPGKVAVIQEQGMSGVDVVRRVPTPARRDNVEATVPIEIPGRDPVPATDDPVQSPFGRSIAEPSMLIEVQPE